MKAIAVFEIDKKVFDELSNEDLSMRLLWDFDIMWAEKSKYFDHVILRPLPEKLVLFGYLDAGNEDGLYEKGYNDCIDEIAGE